MTPLSFAIIAIVLVGVFLVNSASVSVNAQHQHNYGYDNEEYNTQTNNYEYYDYENSCKDGLKVYLTLYGQSYDFTEYKVTFSGNGYSKSGIFPSTQHEVRYLFYEGIIPEFGEFRVTVRDLNSNEVVSTTGYNSPSCIIEHVSLRVPQ